MTTLVTMFLVILMAMGGTGATVFAAQGSLPDQPLYGLKLASEDARYGSTTNTQARLEIALQYADRRAGEMAAIAEQGKATPVQVQARWETHVEEAFRLAAGMGEPEMKGALEQIRERLQNQARLLNQLQDGQPGDAVMQQVRVRLQERINQCDEGLNGPQGQQQQEQQGKPDEPGSGNPGSDEMPAPGNGYGPGDGDGNCKVEDPECVKPGTGENSKNPWTEDPPVPGSGYGPGDGDGTCDGCEQDGAGPGPGDGDGTCDGCEQDGNGPGTQGPGENANPNPEPGPGSEDSGSGQGGSSEGSGSQDGSNSGSGSGGGGGKP